MAGKQKKKKNLIKAGILSLIFVVALGSYFLWNYFNTEKEFTVYTSMEEPSLPLVYASAYDLQINMMHGYVQDMGNAAAEDCIAVLPQNRKLELRVVNYGNTIAGISYEIRNLDLSHFIENTAVEVPEGTEEAFTVTLPIQNMIEKDKQYLLSLKLEMGEQTVNYYTRIIWTDSDSAYRMLSFASDFTKKTFDYEAAKELTTYLETNDASDQSSLGEVSLQSSFSQLTWGNSGMQLATDLDLKLSQYDGIMGTVESRYMTTRQNEYGTTERYQVTDTFTMRVGAERIYLMDYDRRVNQIFDGNKQAFTGKQIQLGITNEDQVSADKSENSQFIAFTADRELWMYDQKRKYAVNVFSFRSGTDDGARANYDRHDIKILSVEDNGDIDFVVYGYMNRGRHEGTNGIVYYQYSHSSGILTERFFIPRSETYEKIALEIGELCAKGGSDMFYVKQADSIIAIDLKSLETLDIAENLADGTYAVNADQTKVAWQEGGAYTSEQIKFMSISDGTTQTIAAEKGEYLRVLGFMEQDLVYGYARTGDTWMKSGIVHGLPMFRIEIVSDQLVSLKTYEREGSYVDEVTTEGNRIHLKLVRKNETNDANHAYLENGSDTIVYQNETPDQRLRYIGSSSSREKLKTYHVMLDEEIKAAKSLRVSTPRKISYEKAGTIELLPSEETDALWFYAYSRGRLVRKTTKFAKAVEAAYDGFGWVTDENSRILYNRTDRESLAKISYPSEEMEQFETHLAEFKESRQFDDGWILLNAQDLNFNQILYYVYKGNPVIVYLEDMQYLYIAGYDNFNVRFYDPQAEEAERSFLMGKEDAECFLTEHQNDYVCGIYWKD